MNSIHNNDVTCYSVAPWISWREYEISKLKKIIIYDQKSHVYYLLQGSAIITWRTFFDGSQNKYISLSPLKQLIDDGIIISHSKYNDINSVGNTDAVVKYNNIPDFFLDDLKKEGYFFDAHWDITNKCNERCIHCYNNNAHNRLRNNSTNELSFEEAKELVDDLCFLGVFRLVISGGEVLTIDFFLPLCKYIRQCNIQLIIYTNGLAFTKSLLSELSQIYPSTICFSIYGDTDAVHDSVTRVNGSYKRSLSAMKYLKEHGIEVHHKNTLLKINFSCWRNTLTNGRKLANRSLLNCTIYPSMDSKKLSEYSLDESQLLEMALTEESPIYYGRTIRGACNIFKDKSETPCYNTTNNLYVNPKGEVCLCIAFPCIIASLHEGNIRKLKRRQTPIPFKIDFTILSGVERLDNWRALKISDLIECGCYDYCKFCIDVCPGDAFLLTGNLLSAPENHCAIAKARFKAYQIMSKKNDHSVFN